MSSPLRVFELEVSRLRSLYLSCRRALLESTNSLRADNRVLLQPVLEDPADPESEALSGSGYAYLRRAKSTFPKCLREMIYVRLLSAFEFYLIETIRSLFVSHRQLFHTAKELPFSVEEVLSTDSVSQLWSRILNADVRTLTSRGFKEIRKYFRRRIGIDFAEICPSVAQLEERHERRHLLVHRIGRTDDRYRHHYQTEERSVSISEAYLEDSLIVLVDFARKLDDAVRDRKAATIPIPSPRAAVERLMLRVHVKCLPGRMFTDRHFRFRVDDDLSSLSDILISHYSRFEDHKLILEGPPLVVRAYLKRIKRANRRGLLEIVSCDAMSMRTGTPPALRADNELVEKLMNWAPEPPWPIGLHRRAAEVFGVSPSRAWDALAAIKYKRLSEGEWILVDESELGESQNGA